MNIAKKAQAIPQKVTPSSWEGYEHYLGYGVMVAPFSSGDLLGLRVFPENDFAPYTSVWHCNPEGEWSIYNDGFSLNTTCPRWWGNALSHAALANIDLTWTKPNELLVEMEKPSLKWKMTMNAPLPLRMLNAVNASLPVWTWKSNFLQKAREWISKKFLGMGNIRLSVITPNGQTATLMPKEIFFIDTSAALLEGRNLGNLVHMNDNPAIGEVPLPIRPTFIIGQTHGLITDMDEYHKTRKEMGSETNLLT